MRSTRVFLIIAVAFIHFNLSAQPRLNTGDIYYARFWNAEGWILFSTHNFLFFRCSDDDTRTSTIPVIGIAEGIWRFDHDTLQLKATKTDFTSFHSDVVRYKGSGGKNWDSVYLSFHITGMNSQTAGVLIHFMDSTKKERYFQCDTSGNVSITLSQAYPIRSIDVVDLGFDRRTVQLATTSNIHEFYIDFSDGNNRIRSMIFPDLTATYKLSHDRLYYFSNNIFLRVPGSGKTPSAIETIINHSAYLSARWKQFVSK